MLLYDKQHIHLSLPVKARQVAHPAMKLHQRLLVLPNPIREECW